MVATFVLSAGAWLFLYRLLIVAEVFRCQGISYSYSFVFLDCDVQLRQFGVLREHPGKLYPMLEPTVTEIPAP